MDLERVDIDSKKAKLETLGQYSTTGARGALLMMDAPGSEWVTNKVKQLNDYKSNFRSPSLIHPIFRKISPNTQESTAGRTKQTIRIPIHILDPPPMAV